MRRRKKYFRQREQPVCKTCGRRLHSVFKELKESPYDWSRESKEENAEKG